MQTLGDDQDQTTSLDLHEATMEEVKAGHLQGTLSKEKLDEKFGEWSWLSQEGLRCSKGHPRIRKPGLLMTAKEVGSTARALQQTSRSRLM